MSNLKVSQKSGPVLHGDQSVTHSHSTNHAEADGDVHDQRHALDNTPVQHRDLETQGRQVRARFEGQSDNGLHKGQLKHASNSTFQQGNANSTNRPLIDLDARSNPGFQRSHGNQENSQSFHTEHSSSTWQGNNGRGQQQNVQSGRQLQSSNPCAFDRSSQSHSPSNHSSANARIGESVRTLRTQVSNILENQSTTDVQRLRIGFSYSRPRVERLGDNLRTHLNHPEFSYSPRGPKQESHGHSEHDSHGRGFELDGHRFG